MNTVIINNYSQRLGWGRGWLACFFIQHLWPQSLYFSVVKFFSFLFYVKPISHNYNNANNIKNKICCTNFEHKSSWKLLSCFQNIKHKTLIFFQNLAILKKYSVVHRPPVVLHRLPATGNSCGRHVTHCLPVMMRWHWIHPSLWRAEYRSCWSTLWWFWLTLRSCRWESEKSC